VVTVSNRIILNQVKDETMINIGLIGFGNVGTGVIEIFQKNQQLLKQRTKLDINIVAIADHHLDNVKKLAPGIKCTNDALEIINDPNIHIVIEAIGGEHPAYEFICAALKNKKYVVTSNKEVISKHKKEFFKLAQENGVDIFFEAAVGGGVPLIRTLKMGLSANQIEAIYGILNGTTNYILTKIEEEIGH